jgi:hypothetical protein
VDLLNALFLGVPPDQRIEDCKYVAPVFHHAVEDVAEFRVALGVPMPLQQDRLGYLDVAPELFGRMATQEQAIEERRFPLGKREVCGDFGLYDLWYRGHEKNAVYRKAYPRQVVQPARCGLAGKASTGRFSRQQAWFQGLPSGIKSLTPFPIWEWIGGALYPPRAAWPAREGEQRGGCHPVLTGLGCC